MAAVTSMASPPAMTAGTFDIVEVAWISETTGQTRPWRLWAQRLIAALLLVDLLLGGTGDPLAAVLRTLKRVLR